MRKEEPTTDNAICMPGMGGQVQGGISTPKDQPFILLFSSDNGELYGYEDGWDSRETFLYTGEGQRGDMEFTRGNLAIRDHQMNGKALYLFQAKSKGYYEFLGEFACDS